MSVSKKTRLESIPIAIVGVSGLFPGSHDVGGYWRDILAGHDLVTEVPSTHFLLDDCYDPDPSVPDKTYCKTGAFLSPVDFDPMEFGIPPTNIATTDTSQLLALIVAKQVIEDATQGQFSKMDRDRTSVILGVATGLELLGEMASRLARPTWTKALREEGIPEDQVQNICDRILTNYTPWTESTFPGLLGNIVAGRIANRFDLGGTNCTSDAACASSFSALAMALNELYLYQSDMVITGGVDTNNDPFLFVSFSKTPALSPTSDCRPFSEEANGMVLGEGLGMLALKRLEDAERDGDRIYAVIKGIGTSSDGKGTSIYAPLPDGQAKALQRCYEVAGYSPSTVELVEAHGTGTVAGDTVEFQGLTTVFDGVGREDRQWCALGSVKSQIGHTKSAAAAAGLIKAVMALHHKVLPPTIKVNRPDPKLDIVNSPFYLNTETRPWIRDKYCPRRASVSSFGFGGTNFHVTLEEYTGPGKCAWRLRTSPSELVLLSAEDEKALVALCEKTAKDLDTEGVLPYLARTSQEGFDFRLRARLSIVATDENDLEKKLKQAAETISKKPREAFSFPNGICHAYGAKPGPIAFLFPGQGSQYLGMGADLSMHFDEVREIWDTAATIPMDDNTRLHEVVFPRPVFSEDEQKGLSRRLTQTEWAQPAISTTSLGMLVILKALGIKPDCVGGHSLGEVTALFEAGVLDLSSLLKVARKRGELMAEAASTPGSMTAILQPLDKIEPFLKEWKSEAVVANHNSPKQVVLSGPTPAIEEVEQRLAEEGIKARRLQVSTAFHSSLMKNSCDPFFDFLKEISFNSPAIPIYSNADAAPYPDDDAAGVRALLTKQISHPVRFVEQIEAMYKNGMRTFIEVGPGSVLTNLVGQCLEGRPHLAVNVDRKGGHGITSLWNALGRLVVNGVPVDISPLWKDYPPLTDPREKKKPKLTVPLMGCNYNKPYPPPGGLDALPKPNPPQPQPNDKTSPPSKTMSHAVEGVHIDPARNAGFRQTSSDRTPTPVANSSMSKAPASNHSIAVDEPTDPSPNVGAPVKSTSDKPVSILPVSKPSTPITDPFGGDNGNQSAWIMAYQEVQRQTAEAYAISQKTMAESHMAFLKSAEVSNATLGAMITGQYLQNGAVYTGDVSSAVSFQPWAAPNASINIPSVSVPSPDPFSAALQAPPAATGLSASEPSAVPLATTPMVSTPVPTVSVPDDIDFQEMLLSVVAEKTGYPKEILTVDMNLELDLGIDSIKRVEIFSAIKDQSPWLPEVDAGVMANIQTLGDVLAYIEKFTPSMRDSTSTPATAVSHDTQPPPPAMTAPDNIDFQEMLLSVVAEKTGYPKEILTVDMNLESDLGIDSIKRVEIFSAIKDQSPWLPEVDAGVMANIQTLGDVLSYIKKFASGMKGGELAEDLASIKTEAESIEAPLDETDGGDTKPDEIGRYALREVPAPHSGFSMKGLISGGPVVVTNDGTGVAQALAEKLRDRGVNARIVDEIPDQAGVVIFLGGLRESLDDDSAIAVNREVFLAAKKVAKRFASSRGIFVTVQDTGGDFGLSGNARPCVWLGGLPGLVKTAALEWPEASVKAIDLERGDRSADELAEALSHELFTGGPEIEVGLHADGSRIRLESYRAALTHGDLKVDDQSVIVASGGARGVTSLTLIELARQFHPRIVLLGRTPLMNEPPSCREALNDGELKLALLEEANAEGRPITPAELGGRTRQILANREIGATLRALQEAGSKARYFTLDVQDTQALTAALESIREEWGPITGIIHGAGVLTDKLIAEKTPEQFDLVFNTKVQGLRSLLSATATDPLSVICLFSSVAARFGNMGQCDYAMANEILNKVANSEASRRKGTCLVKSLNWGPWDGGMVSPFLKAHFKKMGVSLIPLDVGPRKLVDEIREGPSQKAEIVIGPAPPQGGLSVGTTDRAMDLKLLVNDTYYPFLDSHRIKDVPVVPVTMVLEWFSRAAHLFFPDLSFVACKDLNVLRGIPLDSCFQNGSDRLTLCCRHDSNGHGAILYMELRGMEGARHYTATVEMAELGHDNGRSPTNSFSKELEPWTYDVSTIYNDQLFHGPDFQVIRSLKGVSDKAATAILAGTREMGWPGDLWKTDVAALDGGFQLALLWGSRLLGKKSLPTRIGAYFKHHDGLVKGPIHCHLEGEVVGSDRIMSDLSFFNEEEKLVAEMCAVEMHMLPDAS